MKYAFRLFVVGGAIVAALLALGAPASWWGRSLLTRRECAAVVTHTRRQRTGVI